MNITYTQCKQLRDLDFYHWQDIVGDLRSQPAWITQPLEIYDIQAIQHGGCESGAYMPAVTYYDAAQTMGKYGDDVFTYIESQYGELPDVPSLFNLKQSSWGGIAVFFLSFAVELWCSQFDLTGVDWD